MPDAQRIAPALTREQLAAMLLEAWNRGYEVGRRHGQEELRHDIERRDARRAAADAEVDGVLRRWRPERPEATE